ncbi:phage portal protein [Nitratidesulfovibrio sp. 1201_IL3209]|uniref:phage portal protein n=1 Tax=Nitratidesulfovibrio sp. 1201_IL3209 TaxID=3084053 RepID=UPI002FD8F6BB
MRAGEALHNAVTGVVGGLLGAFSPGAALRYRQGRAALLSYAAATRKGPNARWNPRDIHPDLMNVRDRRLVQARARDLVRNNPNVAGAVEKISNNVVHTGIVPQAQLRDNAGRRDKAANQRVEDDFARWADAVNLWELQELHCRHMWTDGGYLAHFHLDRALLRRGLVPLGLELLEYDQLDRRMHGRLANGNVARWGTEYDASGHPVARHVIPCNPGDDLLPGLAESLRIPAAWIPLVMRRTRINQTVPVSWMAAAIMTMHNFSEYQSSEQIAARLASAFGVFVTLPSEGAGNDLNGNPIGSIGAIAGGRTTDGKIIGPERFIGAGRIDTMPAGAKIEIAQYDRPGTTYEPYSQVTLRSGSTVFGMSAEAFSNDYSDASYSSVRQAVLEERRSYRVQQQFLVRRFMGPAWAMWCDMRSLFGLGAEGPVIPVRWQTPGWEWVDPTKDAQSAEKRLALGLDDRHSLCAERGRDFDDVLEMQAEEAEAMRAKRLNPEPWNKAGGNGSDPGALPPGDDGGDPEDDLDDDDAARPARQ